MDSANVSGTDRRTETQRSNKSYVKQQLESIYQQMARIMIHLVIYKDLCIRPCCK